MSKEQFDKLVTQLDKNKPLVALVIIGIFSVALTALFLGFPQVALWSVLIPTVGVCFIVAD